MAFPVDEARIVVAEEALGRSLPEALRTRLLRDNGVDIEAAGELGDDEWQLHPVWDDSDRKRAGRTANHIVRETEEARTWAGFPDGAVAVADNGTGDKLVVLSGDDRVRWWDHESGATHEVVVGWQ
jgi:hypothetical protein